MKPHLLSRAMVALVALSVVLLGAPCLEAATVDPWVILDQAAHDPDPASARKRLDNLLLEQPNFYAGHYNLGTLLLTSDPEAACQHFTIATQSPQTDLAADAWHNLALARWRQGRLEDAVRAGESALRLRPQDAQEQRLSSELRRILIVRADEARRQAEEEAKKLHLVHYSLPDAHVGEAYDQRLAAAGGAGGYRFSLGATHATDAAASAAAPSAPSTTVTLPTGLLLDGDGRIHGTPQKPGSHELSIAVRDQAGTVVTGNISLLIIPAPAITTTQLPEAISGSTYTAELTSIGLDNPTWTITGLPQDLTLDSGGGAVTHVSGIARETGTFALKITANDGKRSAHATLPLVVSDLFAPELAVLPPATTWAHYQCTVGVHGPAQVYTWQAAAQGGMSIGPDGTVSGAPDKAGNLKLSATIHAADGRTRDVTMTLPVNPPPLVDESGNIEVTQGQAVDRPVHSSGGTPPLRWHLVDGILPKGLRLDQDGSLRGVATTPGQAGVTIALEDHWLATAQQKITIVVKPSDKHQDQKDQKDEAKKDQKKDDKDGKNGKDGKDQDQKQQQQQAHNSQDQKNDKNQKNGKDQQDQQKDQKSDDGKNGEKNGSQDQAKNDAQKRNEEKQKQDDRQQNQAPGTGAPRTAAQDAAAQAHALNQAAADRWLDQLPKEDRKVLRYQLLDGGQSPPQYQGKPW